MEMDLLGCMNTLGSLRYSRHPSLVLIPRICRSPSHHCVGSIRYSRHLTSGQMRSIRSFVARSVTVRIS